MSMAGAYADLRSENAALRAQVEELTRERNDFRAALESACLISGAPGPHADPDQCREQIVNVLGTLMRLKDQAEQKLAAVVEAAYWVLRYDHEPDCNSCQDGRKQLSAALAGAREQPTQEKPG
jgi:hypothetical protein